MTDSTSATSAADGSSSDHIGYADALRELDTILRELEGSDVDVDLLTGRVERASELIALCRERIAAAQVTVQRVTADLGAAAPVPGDDIDD